jgi:DNA invertase Pin-like site-specific DNA recombinase
MIAQEETKMTSGRPRQAGIYARVSTLEQQPENQIGPLKAFACARGWLVKEFIDHGVSGAKERRPALDALMSAARTRKIDVIVVVKLDRLARSVHHLLTIARELEALGIDLVVLDQQLDTSTPAGRLLFNVLGAISEFERDLIRDRVLAGLRRAKAEGRRLGRPRKHQVDVRRVQELVATGISVRAIGRKLGVHPMVVRRSLEQLPAPAVARS